MNAATVLDAAWRASRAEVAWSDRHGHLRAAAIVPLTIDGDVVAALPFARSALANALADVTRATLTLTDPRMAWKGWTALAVPVTVTVHADRDGAWTWTGALDQELRIHPPSRLLIDTPIQRREHWWYVPRWIVTMTPDAPARRLVRRAGAADGVLFWPDGDRVDALTVAVDDSDADTIELTPLDGRTWSADDSQALLFLHDFSIPDQERAAAVEIVGVRSQRQLRVIRRTGAARFEPAGGVLRRVARQRALARACRTALAAYDDATSVAAAT